MYSHDTLGLGHLTRTLRLARGITEAFPDSRGLVITGSPVTHLFNFPDRVDYIKLPSVRKVGPEQYESRNLGIPFARLRNMRSSMILDAVREFRPHAVLVDNVPLGMKGEMRPSLEWLRRFRPEVRIHLDLRDVLDDPATIRGTWRQAGVYEVLDRCYDAIHVFGCESFHDAVGNYDLPPDKTRHLGYLAPPSPGGSPAAPTSGFPGRRRILVTTGGAEDGVLLVRTVLRIQRAMRTSSPYEFHIVLGPMMAPADRTDLLAEADGLTGVCLHEYVPELHGWMSSFDAVLSMGGYNTLTEVLTYARRSLVVPRVRPRREQEIRARAFESRGLLRVLHPSECAPESLESSLQTTLECGPDLQAGSRPPLAGLAGFQERLRRLLQPRSGRSREGAGAARINDALRRGFEAGVLVLAGALGGVVPAIADLLPREAQISVLGGYDSNLLDSSDDELAAFAARRPGSFFVVDRLDDALVEVGGEAKWGLGRLFGWRSSLALGYQRRQFVHETIRSEDRFDAGLLARPTDRSRLGIEATYRPQIYGRHRLDKDARPGDYLFRAEVQKRLDLDLTWRQKLGSSLEGRLGLESTLQDYVPAFNERDRVRLGGSAGARWNAWKHTALSVDGSFRRSRSRNEPYVGSDLSYREWLLEPGVVTTLAPLALTLTLTVEMGWRAYTSSDPEDGNHYRRHDFATALHTELTQPVARGVAGLVTYDYQNRQAGLESDPTGEFDEEGAFSQYVVKAGLVWGWSR